MPGQPSLMPTSLQDLEETFARRPHWHRQQTGRRKHGAKHGMLAAGKAIQRAGREGDPAKRSAGAGAYIACAQRRKIRAVRHAAKRRQGTGKPIVTLSIPATRGVGGVEGPVPLTPCPPPGGDPTRMPGKKRQVGAL